MVVNVGSILFGVTIIYYNIRSADWHGLSEDGFLILTQGLGIDKSYVTPVLLEALGGAKACTRTRLVLRALGDPRA